MNERFREDPTTPEGSQELNRYDFNELTEEILKVTWKFPYGELQEEERLLKKLEGASGIFERALKLDRSHALRVMRSLEYLTDCADYSRDYDPHANIFSAVGLELVTHLRPKLEDALKEGRIPMYEIGDVLDLYQKVATRDIHLETRLKGVRGLEDHMDTIERNIGGGKMAFKYLGYIETILDTETDALRKFKTIEVLLRAAEAHRDKPQFASIASLPFKYEEGITTGESVVRPVLDKFGLPPDSILAAWKISDSSGGLRSAIYKNLNTIIELEKRKPGISKFLYEEFRIADFGRYPIELLLNQQQEFDNLGNPYGIIIFPRNDYNGAFYKAHVFEDLLPKIRGQFSLRVVECESKQDVARALIKLDRRYNPPDGSGHRISLLIIGGHGTEDSIRFGGDDERHILYIEDLLGPGVGRTNKFFEPNPTIILSSCSTGVDKGMGQELSKILGAKVIAPKKPTSLSEIQVGKHPGTKFRFNAKFRDEETKKQYFEGKDMGV